MVPFGASVEEIPLIIGRHVPEGRAGDEEPPVGIGLGHDRAEVPVTDRELAGQRVVEGQLLMAGK